MLDNTENQRLHERIAEVASFIPGPVANAAPSFEESAGPLESLPFHKNKVERILERVYNRITSEAGENVDPSLCELLAETLTHPEAAPAYPERKLERILARVQARLEADKASPSAEPAKKQARRLSALASLRSAASALLLRHLSFETRLLSDRHGPRPLTDGPTE